MYEDYLAGRIAQLRNQRGYSARDMSLAIGQNTNYINQIENKKSLPSIQGFFYICEYLNVTPHEFFEEDNKNPEMLNNLLDRLKKLDEDNLQIVMTLVEKLINK